MQQNPPHIPTTILLDLTKLTVRVHPFATTTKEEATALKSLQDEAYIAASSANTHTSTVSCLAQK